MFHLIHYSRLLINRNLKQNCCVNETTASDTNGFVLEFCMPVRLVVNGTPVKWSLLYIEKFVMSKYDCRFVPPAKTVACEPELRCEGYLYFYFECCCLY